MNILPFVTILLFVLSLCSMGFFQSYKTTAEASFSFISQMDTSTCLRGDIERRLFNKSKKKEKPDKEKPTANANKPKKAKKSTKEIENSPETVRNGESVVTCMTTLGEQKIKESQEKVNSRDHKKYVTFRMRNITENSKLNIATLFKKKDSRLEKSLIQLIENCYQDTPLFKQAQIEGNLSVLIVSELIERGQLLGFENLTLNRIQLKNPDLHDIWHKMLKGSQNKKIPRLSDFVIINKDPKRLPICTRKASVPVLNAFFGEEVTKMILDAEQDKYFAEPGKKSPLDKEQFKAVLKEAGLPDLSDYLMDKYQEKMHHIVSYTNNETGVIAELVVYENLQKTPNPKEPNIP